MPVNDERFEKAARQYNEACDLCTAEPQSSPDEIEALLSSCIKTIGSEGVDENMAVLLARAQVMLGQLVEWKECSRALELYESAADNDPANTEALVQLGRIKWKEAVSKDDLDEAEAYFRQVLDGQEENEEQEEEEEDEEEQEEEDSGVAEAKNLLARFLCQAPGREEEAHQLLRKIGFKYALSTDVTNGTALISSESDNKFTSKGPEKSEFVCAFDDVLPTHMLQHLQTAFGRASPFWGEHFYDGPSSAFFSYQMPLAPECSSSSTSFEQVIHSLWRSACKGMPRLEKACFAEWWTHCRPHCNGHKLHYGNVFFVFLFSYHHLFYHSMFASTCHRLRARPRHRGRGW